ncbi:MAG: DUF1684 domain-containing protein [Bacteroidia bacterium]|jgi:uncharacterized protein (DUF1684 family)|nr:DUF1684 domain-containing protein [Bacteroidia bacterium]
MRPLLSWRALAVVLALIIGGLLLWPRKTPAGSAPLPLCEKPWGTYQQLLQEARRQKDSVFRADARSPIPAEARGSFAGLRYFPPDSQWRLRGRYEPLPNALAPVVGALWLNLPTLPTCQSPARLLVYGEKNGQLYIAFWDSTAVQGLTYEGGRYVPIELHSDSACIDFNRAYFPYCAYNPAYICLPYPPENRFCLSIPAGERW